MNYVLDLPLVQAIQYDGSTESKVEIENLLNDISVIIESSKGKVLLLQCPQNLNVTFMQRREMKKLEDDLFKNGTSFI